MDNAQRGEFPVHFSWIVEDELCALAFPYKPGNMTYLVDNNVGYLVSLTAESIPNIQGFEKDLRLIHIKIEDFTAPTLLQVDRFLDVMETGKKTNKAVAIHCAHGRGRTGTMAACYLVKIFGMTSQQAITKIRELRPGSIETTTQEELVAEYERTYKDKLL